MRNHRSQQQFYCALPLSLLIDAAADKVPPAVAEKIKAVRVEYGLKPDYVANRASYTEGRETLSQEREQKFVDSITALIPRATVADYVDHLDYIVKRIGVGHVGIGSEFNHGSGITGFNDENEAPNVTRELVRRGYTEEQIGKIWSGNFLRVFRAVEAAAKTLGAKKAGTVAWA